MIASLMLAFVVTVLALLLLTRYAEKWSLMARPGEHRQHETATPMVGGLAMFVGFSVSQWLFNAQIFAALFIPLALMTLLGLLDDRFKLASLLRFIIQGLLIFVLIKLSGVQLTSLGYLVGNDEVLLGRWQLPLTVFGMLGVVNAINMTDGMDGLAGVTVIMVALGLLISGVEDSLLLVTLIGSVTGFLLFNIRLFKPQARVFMGDAGSLFLGLLIAWLLVKHTQAPSNALYPVSALWLVALPLIDTVSVMIVRPLLGRSPFSADRIHYHHLLQDHGLSVNQSLTVIAGLLAICVAVGVSASILKWSQPTLFALFLSVFVVYLTYLYCYAKRQDMK